MYAFNASTQFNITMTHHQNSTDEPRFITAMIEGRRSRYHANQDCTPAFLDWLDTTDRPGVAANEAWNAGCADIVNKIKHLPLTDIDELSKVHCSSYASPHHITFSSTGLPSLINAAITQAQGKTK